MIYMVEFRFRFDYLLKVVENHLEIYLVMLKTLISKKQLSSFEDEEYRKH